MRTKKRKTLKERFLASAKKKIQAYKRRKNLFGIPKRHVYFSVASILIISLALATWIMLITDFYEQQKVETKLKHEKEVCLLKSTMLNDSPLNFDKYFESSAFVIDYVRNVNPDISNSDAIRFVKAIDVASRKYSRVNPARLLFTAEIETDFRTKVKSKTGAVGIMGVQPNIWLKRCNPKNKMNLSAVGIETVDQLKTIEGSVEASAWILNSYGEECEDLERNHPGEFKMRYQNVSECTSEKYLGGSYGFYHTRLKRAVGNFWFWMVERTATGKKEI